MDVVAYEARIPLTAVMYLNILFFFLHVSSCAISHVNNQCSGKVRKTWVGHVVFALDTQVHIKKINILHKYI